MSRSGQVVRLLGVGAGITVKQQCALSVRRGRAAVRLRWPTVWLTCLQSSARASENPLCSIWHDDSRRSALVLFRLFDRI